MPGRSNKSNRVLSAPVFLATFFSTKKKGKAWIRQILLLLAWFHLSCSTILAALKENWSRKPLNSRRSSEIFAYVTLIPPGTGSVDLTNLVWVWLSHKWLTLEISAIHPVFRYITSSVLKSTLSSYCHQFSKTATVHLSLCIRIEMRTRDGNQMSQGIPNHSQSCPIYIFALHGGQPLFSRQMWGAHLQPVCHTYG